MFEFFWRTEDGKNKLEKSSFYNTLASQCHCCAVWVAHVLSSIIKHFIYIFYVYTLFVEISFQIIKKNEGKTKLQNKKRWIVHDFLKILLENEAFYIQCTMKEIDWILSRWFFLISRITLLLLKCITFPSIEHHIEIEYLGCQGNVQHLFTPSNKSIRIRI